LVVLAIEVRIDGYYVKEGGSGGKNALIGISYQRYRNWLNRFIGPRNRTPACCRPESGACRPAFGASATHAEGMQRFCFSVEKEPK